MRKRRENHVETISIVWDDTLDQYRQADHRDATSDYAVMTIPLSYWTRYNAALAALTAAEDQLRLFWPEPEVGDITTIDITPRRPVSGYTPPPTAG